MAIAKILQRLVPRFASEILGLSHSFLVGRALSSKLMMWYLPSVQNLGKDVGTSFAFDLYAPRFFNEVQSCHQLGFHPMATVPTLAEILKALLMIKGSLDMVLDLNYLLSCLVDDLWVSKLSIFNLIPTDRLLTLASIQCLKRSSLNAGMVTVVVRKFYQRLPIQLLQVLIHLIQPKMDGIL
nr:hypothetical protein [Tanacetum cinerariifolium]